MFIVFRLSPASLDRYVAALPAMSLAPSRFIQRRSYTSKAVRAPVLLGTVSLFRFAVGRSQSRRAGLISAWLLSYIVPAATNRAAIVRERLAS